MPTVPGSCLFSSAASVSAVKAVMSPNGTKTIRVTVEDQHEAEGDQDIDGAGGDAIDGQYRGDLRVHDYLAQIAAIQATVHQG